MQFVSDMTITIEDRFELEEFFDGLLTPFNAYTYFVCMMVLLLSFFMMIVSFSQKMHDLEWEQGVLRAIGLTKVQSKKLFFYEAFCIVSSSFIAGILVGLFATLLTSASFAQLTQLPRRTIVPYAQVGFILLIIVVATYTAVTVPANSMNKKQVASQIK